LPIHGHMLLLLLNITMLVCTELSGMNLLKAKHNWMHSNPTSDYTMGKASVWVSLDRPLHIGMVHSARLIWGEFHSKQCAFARGWRL